MKPNCSLIIDGFSLEVAISKQNIKLENFNVAKWVNTIEKEDDLRFVHKHFLFCFPRKQDNETTVLQEKLKQNNFQTYSAMKIYGNYQAKKSLIKSNVVGIGAIMATILSIELLDHKHDEVYIVTSDIAVASSLYILNRKKEGVTTVIGNKYLVTPSALKKVADFYTTKSFM